MGSIGMANCDNGGCSLSETDLDDIPKVPHDVAVPGDYCPPEGPDGDDECEELRREVQRLKKLASSLGECRHGMEDDDLFIFTDVPLEDVLSGDYSARVAPAASLEWKSVPYELIHNNSTAFTLFTDEAFCYYLPSAMILSIKENDTDMLCFTSIFSRNWSVLEFNIDEINVIKKWLNWVVDAGSFFESELAEILNISFKN